MAKFKQEAPNQKVLNQAKANSTNGQIKLQVVMEVKHGYAISVINDVHIVNFHELKKLTPLAAVRSFLNEQDWENCKSVQFTYANKLLIKVNSTVYVEPEELDIETAPMTDEPEPMNEALVVDGKAKMYMDGDLIGEGTCKTDISVDAGDSVASTIIAAGNVQDNATEVVNTLEESIAYEEDGDTVSAAIEWEKAKERGVKVMYGLKGLLKDAKTRLKMRKPYAIFTINIPGADFGHDIEFNKVRVRREDGCNVVEVRSRHTSKWYMVCPIKDADYKLDAHLKAQGW